MGNLRIYSKMLNGLDKTDSKVLGKQSIHQYMAKQKLLSSDTMIQNTSTGS